MRTVSANKIIGYLAYKTREELNKNIRFKEAVRVYSKWQTCFSGDYFNLWHYPGTDNEISGVFQKIDNKIQLGSKLKFPSILDYMPVRQDVTNTRTIYYNLAIIAPVNGDWMTDKRDNEVFEPLLRWIYDEFINQIEKSGISLSYNPPKHTYYENFTTDDKEELLVKRYGAWIDAIEMHNLAINIKPLCDKHIQEIYEYDRLVFQDINNLII
jgi:hypothetical protein